jgi:tetratricopeptide (TPR) repeat protein
MEINSSSVTPAPISPACPFPSMPMSEAASNALFGEFTIEAGETTISASFLAGDGSDPDLGMTVHKLVRTGKLDEAVQVAQKIKDVSRKNEALREIASAYKEAGQLDQALQVAKSIAESPQSDNTSLDDHISIRDNALSEIAQAYVKAGQLDQALQVAEIMAEGYRVSTLLDIAEKYRVAEQPNRAAEVIDRAVADYRTAAKPDSTDPVAAAYFKLLVLARFAGQYAAVGRKNRAAELSSELFEVAKTLPQLDYMTFTVLSGTAEVYAAAGQRDKAASVLSYSLETAKNFKETTEAANRLQQAGIIRYNRGRITILNRQKLEAASCSCYGIIKGEFARLLVLQRDLSWLIEQS